MKPYQYDAVVLGAGAAGLTLALRLPKHIRVAVLAKASLTESATLYAQGGISVVLDKNDSVTAHIDDTLSAGAGLCDETTVRYVIENAKRSIEWLINNGVAFTRNNDKKNEYHLTKEGGHSHRRIIHSADATGHAVETTLADQARNAANIDIFDEHIAIDLIKKNNRCVGAYVLNKSSRQIDVFSAKATILATGGAGKVYLYTSNPDVSTGDGIAMAWRVGCRIGNMEFIQFHPTCLYHPDAKSFLMTEALRGEGAKLRLPPTPKSGNKTSNKGQAFLHKFDPRGELAPRDIVARAIDHEIKRLGLDYVHLDISHRDADFIFEHFPTVYERCKEFGFDLTKQAIPVVPAAHYLCGGVVASIDGQTDLEGLYAIGETACTGLHGANRMASNSLLECLVMADAAADHITQFVSKINHPKKIDPWDASRVTPSLETVEINHNWDELRRVMSDYVGIVRSNKRLKLARKRIDNLKQEIHDFYANHHISNDLIELRNLVTVADLIVRSAMIRQESRGLHYTLDYPNSSDTAENTYLSLSDEEY
ncbi:MAG: L-aspartate oxidase [Gammaproteobacteria bacterium]|nr:L-aspartate oxidase [Gammaproteobacteria bacterium]